MRLVSRSTAEDEGQRRRRQDHVIEHRRIAAQPPQIVMRILRHRQEQAGRRVDDVEMVEADAREFGKGDGQDREIDAGDAEAKGEKADDGAASRATGMAASKSEPRRDAVSA